jgi:hypothetical protein
MWRLGDPVEQPFRDQRQIGVIAMGTDQMDAHGHVVGSGMGRQGK